MPRMIDHIVVLTRDLASATRDYTAAGFTVTPGGEHADGLTHNALIPFADGTYLELLAFARPDEPRPHRWWPRLAAGEGLGDFALLSDDLTAEVAAWRQRDLPVSDPLDGGRLRPDGRRVAWRVVNIADAERDGLPFIIQDVTPRDLRVPGGAATEHPNGAAGIAGVAVGATQVIHAAQAYGKLLGDAGATTSDGARFTLGSQWLEIIPMAATGIATLLLRGGDPVRTLDAEPLHGAHITIGE